MFPRSIFASRPPIKLASVPDRVSSIGQRFWTGGSLWICLLAMTMPAIGQPPDQTDSKQSLLPLFHQAREAYANKNWDDASTHFRRVSSQCQGSPLALESNYYATLSDWKRQEANYYDSMQQWLREAKSLQDRMQRARRTAPIVWDDWIANIHLLLVQADRQQQRWDLAEERLSALVERSNGKRTPEWAWPDSASSLGNAWYELGALFHDHRRDYERAIECFQRAVDASPEGSEFRCASIAALAKSQMAFSDWDSSMASIAKLETMVTSDSWRVKATLLRRDIAIATGDATAASESLQPAVTIALAGQIDLPLALELAKALDEMRDFEDSGKIYEHIIQREPNHPLSIEAKIQRAFRAIQRGDWNSAQGDLDQVVAMEYPTAWIPHVRRARSQVLLEKGLPEAAVDDLTIALENVIDDRDLENAVRFELGEALMQLQRWDAAHVHWDHLTQQYPNPDADVPNWFPRVLLHQAEMQALKRNWTESDSIVSRIQSQFPECDCRDDVDYLKARCLISKALFEEARQLLGRIAEEPLPRSADLAARARWMMGETFLLQRRYQEALRAYESVLDTGSSDYWQSAAWMQIGQCHELLRDAKGAQSAYQTVVLRYAEGPFAQGAQQKLDTLQGSETPRASNARSTKDESIVKQR